MPITTYNDISFVLSGGPTNIYPEYSLGGEPSSIPIVDLAVNNLFKDITADQSSAGYVDYRCFYVCNDGPTPVYQVKAWISAQYPDGANVELGVNYKDEVQRVTVSDYSTITGGSLTFSYSGATFVVSFERDSDFGDETQDIENWANNFETAINGLVALSSVSVFGQSSSTNVVFDVSFVDDDGRRVHPSITLVSNDLLPGNTVTISSLQVGSPINSVAAEIGVETNPPGGITFFDASEDTPITLSRLDPNDIFPVWVQRTIEAGATAVAEDGFTFRFSAESLSTP